MISSSFIRSSAVAIRASRRSLTTNCTQSIATLNDILESYRAHNYSRELPRRFREDIVNAVSKESSPLLSSASTGLVCAEGIEHVLSNIGEGDKLTHDEIVSMLREVGGPNNARSDGCTISSNQMLDLISNRIL